MRSWLPVKIPFMQAKEKMAVPASVNWFTNRRCNYSCAFCYHTTKNTFILPMEEGKEGLRLMADAGMRKLNISGGEPFLNPKYIGEVFRFCKEELKLESTSVVCNGSKVTEKWMNEYGRYLDVMAISCDSFDSATNEKQGRMEKDGGDGHITAVKDAVEMCRIHGIKVKINTVVTINNWEEDMNDAINELNPFRWKVFQVLLLDGENTGADTGSIRDARPLTITSEQFQEFLKKHESVKSLVPEDNKTMKDSYLLLDEEFRFLNCQAGDKKPGRSILKVGVEEALRDAGWDSGTFEARGGIYDWSRDKAPEQPALDW